MSFDDNKLGTFSRWPVNYNVDQCSSWVPFVSKYHHSIISFRANYTPNTLGSLPLTFTGSKCQANLLNTFTKHKPNKKVFLWAEKLVPEHQTLGSHPPLSEKFLVGIPTWRAIFCIKNTDKTSQQIIK
jgi:hypothetical protein